MLPRTRTRMTNPMQHHIATAIAVVICAATFLAAPQASVAHYSHSSYSFKENDCKRSSISDPVGIVVSGHAGADTLVVVILTDSFTKALGNIDPKYKTWGRVLAKGDAQFAMDHGRCTSFNEASASGNAVQHRYHARWHQGGEPLENGRWYVAGTPHYDRRCGTSGHKIASWIGPRDLLVRAYKLAGWDAYYRYVDIDNSRVERNEPCTKSVNGNGRALWDDQIAWVRPQS